MRSPLPCPALPCPALFAGDGGDRRGDMVARQPGWIDDKGRVAPWQLGGKVMTGPNSTRGRGYRVTLLPISLAAENAWQTVVPGVARFPAGWVPCLRMATRWLGIMPMLETRRKGGLGK